MVRPSGKRPSSSHPLCSADIGKKARVSLPSSELHAAHKKVASATVQNSNTKGKKKAVMLDIPPPPPKSLSSSELLQPVPKRAADGDLIFPDRPEFRPNMTPKEVLQAGSFGGTYFRDIYSSVLGQKCVDGWKELPLEWLEGLNVNTQVASQVYRESVNTYKVKCGGGLKMWEESGWIKKQDPYGWFQWYCRFYNGRRTQDDARQVDRWAKCAGVKGRWRNNLVTKIYRASASVDDKSVSPVVRQVLQHWGYRLTESHFQLGVKAAAKRLIK